MEDPTTHSIDLQTISQGDTSVKAHRRDTLLGCIAMPFVVIGLFIWLLVRLVNALWINSWLAMSCVCTLILGTTEALFPAASEMVSQRLLLVVGVTVLFKFWRAYLYRPTVQATVLEWDAVTAKLIYRYTVPDRAGKKTTYTFETMLDPTYAPAWQHSGATVVVRYAWAHPERHTLDKALPCRKPFAPRAVVGTGAAVASLTTEMVAEILRTFAQQQCGPDYIAEIEAEALYHLGSEPIGQHDNITWYLSFQPGLALRVTLGESSSDLIIFSAARPLDKHAPNLGLENLQCYGFVSTPGALRALLEHLVNTGTLTWKAESEAKASLNIPSLEVGGT